VLLSRSGRGADRRRIDPLRDVAAPAATWPLFITLASHEPRKELELPIRALRLLLSAA
jgi:hypothetical protein